jgi:hypothetical protein
MVGMEYFLGFILGGIVGLVLVTVVFMFARKGRAGKCIIDERQKLVRGTGFKYAFFTLMIYDVLYFSLATLFPDSFIATPVAIFLGICLSITVFAVYCIWNDGYYAINENQKALTISFTSFALLNFIGFVRGIREHEILVDGKINFPIVNFTATVTLLLIVITTILKSRKRHEDEE